MTDKMTEDEIADVLRLHGMWLRDEDGGVFADLSGADLSYTSLCNANLRFSDLGNTNLIGANLYGADLSGSHMSGTDLRGANLLCIGNQRELRTMQFDRWMIGYTHDTLQIGCQRHSIEKWRRWDTESRRRWISKMDLRSIEWADRNLDLVLKIIDANQADGGSK